MKFRRWLLLMLVPAGSLMVLFVASILQLGWESLYFEGKFGLGHYFAFFARSDYVAVLLKTMEISLITTAVSLIVGYPAAYYIARTPRHRNLLMILVILPWLVSVVVRTYGWIVILGNRGSLNSLLMWLGLTEGPIRLLFNQTGIMIGLVHVFCPFMIISILTVLMHIDRSFEEASMSLGAGPIETFFRVMAPLSMPGVIAGSMIVFLLSTGAIVTPLLLGGPRNGMLSAQIYQDVFQLFNFTKAASMAFILMLLAIILVWPLQLLERRLTRNLKGSEVTL